MTTFILIARSATARRASSSPDQPRRPRPVFRGQQQTRATLIERRMQISAQDRAVWSADISQRLRPELDRASSKLIGFYWPFRGEYDARPVLAALREQGAHLALPVVVEKARPLEFREWRPGIAMTRGVWNIPIPAEGEAVFPDVLIAPLVGFDSSGYRLGYGGGFYDRTIAALPSKPSVIGVGFEFSRLETIYPQAHDVPMDVIVTEVDAWPGLR
ncbi:MULTISPECIES: 5-formyltetrahydrofolate cyclo-ligase [Methylobacterium]|uniref:5-formyltetrahydrofolate cyclo-ligase n=1 Tax=Methylobacterium TaxID=407 RepID=UPI003756D0AD